MKAVLKIEFQRLFRSVTFYISMGIGLILTMTQFVMVGLQESMRILDAYSPKGISEPYGVFRDRKSTRLNSSHTRPSRMPSSA